MDDRLRRALESIRAEDALKNKTSTFLRNEIEAQNSKQRRPMVQVLAVCACFVLLLISGGAFVYFTPSAYIDMDVNPSAVIVVNRFGRVLESSVLSGGEAVFPELYMRHKTYDTAAESLLSAMLESGFLAPGSLVSVTVQAENEQLEKTLLAGLNETVMQSLTAKAGPVETDIFAVSREVRDFAREYNVSPAKYLAICELREIDTTVTFESCAGHSISEIRQIVKSHDSEGHESEHSGHGGRGETSGSHEIPGNPETPSNSKAPDSGADISPSIGHRGGHGHGGGHSRGRN